MKNTHDANLLQYTLDNGLRVVLQNCPGRAVTSAVINVRCGSQHESEQEAGFSHFVEHMLFKGTAKYSAKAISSEVEKRGGMLNASTGHDVTSFYIRMPSISQNIAFKFLAEIFFHPAFPQKDLDKERNVVIEEINQIEDEPYQKLFAAGFKDIFGSHPLGRPIIGYEERIRTCTREQLKSYYHRYYTPTNSVLSIAGGLWKSDKEKNELIVQVEKYFNHTPVEGDTGFIFDTSKRPKAKFAKGIKKEHTKAGLAQSYFFVSLQGYERNLYNGFEIDAYERIVGQGMSSRLFQRIREKLGLCYHIAGLNYQFNPKDSLFIAYGSSKASPERAIAAIIQELQSSLETITKREVADAITAILGKYEIDLDSVHFVANMNASDMLDFNQLRDHEKSKRLIAELTVEKVTAFMSKMWDSFKPTVITLQPLKTEEAA